MRDTRENKNKNKNKKKQGKGGSHWVARWLPIRAVIFVAIFTNILFFLNMSLLKDRGPVQVADFLRDQAEKLETVLFFDQCHRTPYYATIHQNITMKFPDCSPSFETYVPENKQLFLNPRRFIMNWVEEYKPSHIVMITPFFMDEDIRKELLVTRGYKVIREYWSSWLVETPIGDIPDLSYYVLKKY